MVDGSSQADEGESAKAKTSLLILRHYLFNLLKVFRNMRHNQKIDLMDDGKQFAFIGQVTDFKQENNMFFGKISLEATQRMIWRRAKME